MEKKIIAAIAVITMVFVAMVPLVEADTGEESYNTAFPKLGEEFVLCVNEANYNDNGYNASFTWKAKMVAENTNNEAELKEGIVNTIGNYKVKMISGFGGKYVFIINYIGQIQETLPSIFLMWYVSLTAGSVTKSLDPVSFLLNPVQRTTAGTLVEDEIYAVVGELQNKQLKWKEGSQQADEETKNGWQWYAINLPDGLSMSTDGKMIGIPTAETNDEGRTATVTAMRYDKTKFVWESRTANLCVKVAKNMNFIWSVGDGSDESPVGYIAHVDEVVKLVTKVNNAPTVLDSVSVVNDAGEYVSLKPNSEAKDYILPTGGTGSYVVVMKYAGYQTQTMRLYVVAQPAEVTTGIIVSHP